MISKYILHILVPTTGCDVISSGGTCYSYFTHSAINWADSRLQCVSQGYDLATIASSEDNTLLSNLKTSGLWCWIGLNDLNTEQTFVWADGSSNSYRNWDPGQPDNAGSNQDCTLMWTLGYWDDNSCSVTKGCYFCGSNGKHPVSILLKLNVCLSVCVCVCVCPRIGKCCISLYLW